MTGMSEAVFCIKYFDEKGYFWTFSCASGNATNVGMVINSAVSGIFCLSSGVLYIITWLVVKFKTNNAIRAQTSRGYRMSSEVSVIRH